MPELPQIFARTRPAELSLPRAPDAPGAFWEKLAQVSHHIQEGMETAETARLRGEGAASIVGAYTNARIDNADPEEYKRQATEAVREAHQSILDQASTGNVRLRVQSALADDIIRAQTHIAVQYHQKQIDKAEADFDKTYADSLIRVGQPTTSPQERENIEHEIGQLSTSLVAKGLAKSKTMQDKMIAWKKQATINEIRGMIRRDPVEAYDLMRTPKYQQYLDESTLLSLETRARTEAEHNDAKLQKVE